MNNRKRALDWDITELQQIASNYGTPTYVLDIERAISNLSRFTTAVEPATVQFASKTNTDPELVTAVHEQGHQIECASVYEAKRVSDSGVPIEDIHITPVNLPDDQVQLLESLCEAEEPSITLDSKDDIDKLSSIGFTGEVFIRMSAGSQGGAEKFGVQPSQVQETANLAESEGMVVSTVHTHVGTGMLSREDFEPYFELAELVIEKAEQLGGVDIDLGGGYGVPYGENEKPLDLDWFGQKVEEICEMAPSDVILEPGRFVAADAGLLLCSVTSIKEGADSRVVGLDAGYETLVRPAMYGAYHHIEPLTTESRESVRQTVSGPTCEGVDMFCTGRKIRKIKKDDLIAIENAGAYGYVMSNYFHSAPRASCVAVNTGSGTVETIERESLSDVTRPVQK